MHAEKRIVEIVENWYLQWDEEDYVRKETMQEMKNKKTQVVFPI